jgi:hypothetical protein
VVADMYDGVQFLDSKKQGGQTQEEPAEEIQVPF